MSELQFSYFADTNIGMTVGGDRVEEIHNAHGQHYFRAVSLVGSLFGQEINGGEGMELSAIGRTRDEALDRLKNVKRDFNDSLWI